MKKGLLLILGMLMMVSTVEATDGAKTYSKKGYNDRYGARSIQFMERGIKFYVFPNGKIDFKTHKKFKSQYYYRNGYRYKKRTPTRGIHIDRDYYGRVRRVGNVFINYNRFGKVSRVGSVYIDYKHRRMTQVGGLQINYDRFGNKHYYGQVKPRYDVHFRSDRFTGSIFDYNDNFFYDTNFYNDYEDYGEDDDYYYYKSKTDKKSYKKGHKEGKIIKRKKLKQEPSKERKKRS
jgi:hypothetical protein